MRSATAAVVLLMLAPMLSGCFGGGEEPLEEPENVFDTLCPEGIASNVWYHYANATDATTTSSIFNGTDVLVGDNAPVCALGTYYGIGMSTFEPTIGITSADNLFVTSWGNGESGSTAIVRCSGLIGMIGTVEYDCMDVYNPPTVPVANSNDPYVYVDPWTDRIMKFDMHALLGMTVEWSDNEGQSWSPPTVATGTSIQDHQTIASAPYPAPLHPTTWVFCINGNWQSPLCSSSFDGGLTWTQQVPGTPLNCNSGGLTGHMIGANDGNLYRGNPGCDGEGYSIYRTRDGGLTWTEHPLPTETTGTADTWNFEEAQVHPDEENNLHAMWMGIDNMPYYSFSRDEGDSWSDPLMVAPPTNLVGTGFPAISAGGEGRVALAYLGDSGNNTWNGYISIITDAFSDNPLITTVQLNEFGDPLDTTADCGYNRCGGFGDFIDILVDQHGRPWFGLSHNIVDEGIFGTIAIGPSLRGPLAPLPEMPLGGPSTLISDPSGGNSTAQS
ncbi:MAG: hypothetical protein CMA06_00645 [Euryarchaeota archaeon]|nr:hypothetical protein [Euryarchaeota archaeon]RCH73082.1 MAG: exo-alpha-sialidase [Candidatus Poseidoniales archaeon]|tara:strand:- start:315 stop:1811 length:1497 start_codon:yes stop_codon:yes gene_type:complete